MYIEQVPSPILSTKAILDGLKRDPIAFLWKRRDIGYFYEEETQSLRTLSGLKNHLQESFRQVNGFIADPVEEILSIIHHGKTPGGITQFDKDIAVLWLKDSSFFGTKRQSTLGKVKDRISLVLGK